VFNYRTISDGETRQVASLQGENVVIVQSAYSSGLFFNNNPVPVSLVGLVYRGIVYPTDDLLVPPSLVSVVPNSRVVKKSKIITTGNGPKSKSTFAENGEDDDNHDGEVVEAEKDANTMSNTTGTKKVNHRAR